MRFSPGTFKRKTQRNPNYGSATFRSGRKAPGAPGMTLDETLKLIEVEQNRQARTKRPATREQLLAVSKAIAADPRRQAKVKMPVFSIQQD